MHKLDALLLGMDQNPSPIGFVDGASFIVGMKKIADELAAAPDTTGQVEGPFLVPLPEAIELMTHMVSQEFKGQLFYTYYANMMRGLHRDGLADVFTEHAADELEHASYLLRRIGVLSPGGISVPPGEPPPPMTDPAEVVQLLIVEEQKAISLWKQLLAVCGENPMKYTVEQYLQKEEEHQDELWQHVEPEQAAPMPTAETLGAPAAAPMAEAEAPKTASQILDAAVARKLASQTEPKLHLDLTKPEGLAPFGGPTQRMMGDALEAILHERIMNNPHQYHPDAVAHSTKRYAEMHGQQAAAEPMTTEEANRAMVTYKHDPVAKAVIRAHEGRETVVGSTADINPTRNWAIGGGLAGGLGGAALGVGASALRIGPNLGTNLALGGATGALLGAGAGALHGHSQKGHQFINRFMEASFKDQEYHDALTPEQLARMDAAEAHYNRMDEKQAAVAEVRAGEKGGIKLPDDVAAHHWKARAAAEKGDHAEAAKHKKNFEAAYTEWKATNKVASHALDRDTLLRVGMDPSYAGVKSHTVSAQKEAEITKKAGVIFGRGKDPSIVGSKAQQAVAADVASRTAEGGKAHTFSDPILGGLLGRRVKGYATTDAAHAGISPEVVRKHFEAGKLLHDAQKTAGLAHQVTTRLIDSPSAALGYLGSRIGEQFKPEAEVPKIAGDFVFPEHRKYPIHDRDHALAALGMVGMHGTSEEKSTVRAAVEKKYPGLLVKKAAGFTPSLESTLISALLHGGYGAAGGALTGAAAADPGERAQGALRGAGVGGLVGAGVGAAQMHGAPHRLGTLGVLAGAGPLAALAARHHSSPAAAKAPHAPATREELLKAHPIIDKLGVYEDDADKERARQGMIATLEHFSGQLTDDGHAALKAHQAGEHDRLHTAFFDPSVHAQADDFYMQHMGYAGSGEKKAMDRDAVVKEKSKALITNATANLRKMMDTLPKADQARNETNLLTPEMLRTQKAVFDVKTTAPVTKKASLGSLVSKLADDIMVPPPGADTPESYVAREQQLAAQQAMAEASHAKTVSMQSAQAAQQAQAEAQAAQQQLQEAQQQLQQSQAESQQSGQQALQATQQAAEAESRATEHSVAKMQLGMRVNQMRQELANLVMQDPVSEHAATVSDLAAQGQPATPQQQQEAEMAQQQAVDPATGQPVQPSAGTQQEEAEAQNAQQDAEVQGQQAQQAEQADQQKVQQKQSSWAKFAGPPSSVHPLLETMRREAAQTARGAMLKPKGAATGLGKKLLLGAGGVTAAAGLEEAARRSGGHPAEPEKVSGAYRQAARAATGAFEEAAPSFEERLRPHLPGLVAGLGVGILGTKALSGNQGPVPPAYAQYYPGQ